MKTALSLHSEIKNLSEALFFMEKGKKGLDQIPAQ